MTPQVKPFPKLNPKTDAAVETDIVHAGPQRPPPGSRFSLGSGLSGIWTPWKARQSAVFESKPMDDLALEGEQDADAGEKEMKAEVKKELTEEEKNVRC